MSDCFICVRDQSIKLKSTFNIKANINIVHGALCNIKSIGKINTNNITQLGYISTKLNSLSNIRSKNNISHNLFALNSDNILDIKAPLTFTSCSIKSKVSSSSLIKNNYIDKFSGHIEKIKLIDNFIPIHKLYPTNDIQISLNNSYFVNKNLSSGLLYQSIDEGVFLGNYQQNLKTSYRICDDNQSFIQPSSIFTSGTFRYKCEVNKPIHHAKESFLFIRAAAPLSNYGANIPPEYRIHNIKLEDPSGNLIIKYKDLYIRGDCDYNNINPNNFATYISEPEINNLLLHTWDNNYPIMNQPSGYSLNMDFDITCLDDPFSEGFDKGYEEQACEIKALNNISKNDYLSIDGSPLSTQTQGFSLNPTNSLRISAIEIGNSGDLCGTCNISGIKNDNYCGFYLDVSLTGQRLIRNILPSKLLTSSYDIELYPEVYSIWQSSPDGFSNTADNTSVSGANVLLSKLQTSDIANYIQLVHNNPLHDSGRLTLVFSHKSPSSVSTLSDGEFSFGNNSFNSSELQTVEQIDNFFDIDSIELKVIAKKEVGSRDYVLDVVGYSDDRLLNITPKIGGFLQNTNIGSGIVPTTSGFRSIDDFGISSETLSDKSQHFTSQLTTINAGDHYKLSTLPLINSTLFQEYSIPLTINKDDSQLGLSKNYSLSSFFENLYLDLYPIPSGATIATVQLVVTYKPSNALMFYTIGTPPNKELALKNINILPVGVTKNSDIKINSDIDDYPLSLISGIPHAYSENKTLKTNYSRRWRGVDGNIVNGPYNPNQFDFGFFNPESDNPFLYGYFDLNNIDNNYIISNNHASSGYYNGSNTVLKNIGLRLSNTTIDWTNSGDPLYGKICDAFDCALKLDGENANINFGNIPIDSGFALYLRFSPDQHVSGIDYNLFDSGVLVSKWNSGNDLEFSLGFKNGYINVLAKDISNNIIELTDPTIYSDYQYPLSVIVTYIPDSPSGQLKLYCNNELSTSLYLRDYKNIVLSSGDSDLIFGHSYGSGVGISAFIHEIGISNSGNLVHSSPNRLLKQTTVNSFLDGHSHSFNDIANDKFKLYSYIDDGTNSWKLGDFKVCSFSSDFDWLTSRSGKDYLIHKLTHTGENYVDMIALHFDGNNGDTTTRNSSSDNYPVVLNDNAIISTTQSKFGNSSLYLDGIDDCAVINNSNYFNFGSNNWTIEAWIYPLTTAGTRAIMCQRAGTESELAIVLYVLDGSSYLVISEDGSFWSINGGGSETINANEWTHIAAVRYNDTVTVYVNGIASQTHPFSGSIYNSSEPIKIGSGGITFVNQNFNGYIDEVRIINGIAMYKTNFSVPNAPFENTLFGFNTSNISYHTQIENDFIRFNLQDIPDVNPEFYSVHPRICKSLPRGYDFKHNALAVDTIIEHETNNNLIWDDGKIGPKLVVSLYSKNQDPIDRPSKKNWGLINRSIHYLEPSGCYQKLTSNFNYNDLIDTSESWANFDLENIISEFDKKYYSTDLNDMFLQYDLVYPSGSQFQSTIKIHSANVRLDDALTYFANSNNTINLYSSGDKISLSDVDLFIYGKDSINNNLNLIIDGYAWPIASSSFNLLVSGVYGIPNSNFNLFIKNSGIVSSLGPNIYVSGGLPRSEETIPLVMIDNSSLHKVNSSIELLVHGKGAVNFDEILPLIGPSAFTTREIYSINSFNLVTYNTQYIQTESSNNFNLFIGTDPNYVETSGIFNLFTINYPAYNQQLNQQASISWNENNVGKEIDTFDNNKAFLDANDEIRGVDLLCYGNCATNSGCIEEEFILHDNKWSSSDTCIEGGIFRIKNTYTNLDVSGFKTPIGYSGHFYGIRKYDGLIPNAPYSITISTKTGSNKSVELPPQFIEINYGSNEYVGYSGIKLAADSYSNESERNSNNKYGKSVAIKNNLIAVGSPKQTVSYSEYDPSGFLTTTNLEDAGCVYLYRRENRPSGYSWPIDKDRSNYTLETKLTLPSGLLKDYSINVKKNTIGEISLPSQITERFWNVGQEGRQFGHSIDLAISDKYQSFEEDNKEILVVGAPYSKWSRSFDQLQTSGVSVGLLIFTDEFAPSIPNPNNPKDIWNYSKILDVIQSKDLLFKYFSDPPVRFDVKIIICQPISSTSTRTLLDFPEPKPLFITKEIIPRNEGIINENNILAVFSGIKSSFEKAFPYDNNKINNNIPSLLGVYVDNSRSLGRQAVQPALDRFLSYYQDYSFASGLKDFDGISVSGAVYEYTPTEYQPENWISLSITAIDNLLDTGRLVASNQTRFFSSNIGEDAFNINLTEFNHAPPSGGRVYIFEKESGSWNLIQELQSTLISYDSYDVFGHAVAISEDTNIIGVGSPYIDEACKIYQFSSDEKDRLYRDLFNWLTYKNSFYGGLILRYSQLINDYNNWKNEHGLIYANKILYSKLTSSEKFEARKYLDINEYKNIFTYKYSDIPYIGTWDFIPKTFAPTSRLGYSVAINDDGSTVAFGAPTDSFNVFDDFNVYYKNDGYEDPLNIDNINGTIKPSWRSNVNAGAIRLFESRDYYPHNKVVEFRKFGNLQESNPLDSGHFIYLSNIFQDKNFIKTPFTQVDIPKDAGLAFIITPEIDALSDEVVSNIQSWLALGDRNLVLIGNDPVWEEGGKYKQSNDIINKLLEKLKSKVRLHPAKNIYDSLSSGNSTIIPSFRPQYGTQSYIQPSQLNTAYGVADIRIHFPGYRKDMPCDNTGLNTKCELPLVHNGDLRAQWIQSCPDLNCGIKPLRYPVNWAYVFKTYNPECCELLSEILNKDRFDLIDQDPAPLMAAAETTTIQRIIPSVPAKYIEKPIYEEKISYSSTTIYEFDEQNLQTQASFTWSSSSDPYLYDLNINNSSGELFYIPEKFENRQSLLQARAYPITDTIYGSQIITNQTNYCVEQGFGSSKIIAIAGIKTESQNALLSGGSDNNINFYANMVAKNSSGGAKIAQLGGWTGRNSFVSAYSESILYEIFINSGNDVDQNVENISPLYDVCWIANPSNLPSELELLALKSWLNIGNKKLIITHDSSISQVLLVSKLLKSLDTNIEPLFLKVKGEYPVINSVDLVFNQNTDISSGFNIYPITNFYFNINFIPFAQSQNVNNICYNIGTVYDTKIFTDGYWKINSGINKVSFPAIPGSGYKIFVNTVSENQYENYPINLYVKNGYESPRLPYPINTTFGTNINSYILDNLSILKTLSNNINNSIQTISFNVQLPQDKNNIEFYLTSMIDRIYAQDHVPKTIRLLSISGVPLPIKQTIIQGSKKYQEFIGYTTEKISDELPEIIINEPVTRQISSLNDKYCLDEDCVEYNLNNQYIADGPVVVSQEVESLSNFDAGVARSRITVISDSSLVQGRFMVDNDGKLSSNTVSFIRSLYPQTNFPLDISGKQYIEHTKIVAPERGSPQKYIALSNKNGLNDRFNSGNQASPSSFDDKESLYDPRYVKRTELPWPDIAPEDYKKNIINQEINTFNNNQINYGGTAKFSGIMDGVMYADAGLEGGMPQIMKVTGSDYIDFDRFPSGYPGDLFGYSVSLHKNKLVVGSPFTAFSDEIINNWPHYIQTNGQSGIILSNNGGAGSVYIYEKTFKGSGLRNTITPWEFIQKLRPSSINVGQDLSNSGLSQSYSYLGPNSYSNNYLSQFSTATDQFGYDVCIDSDIVAVGAPGHDFDKQLINEIGSYIRKSFNNEFNIVGRSVIDLGNSGIRNNIGSGLSVLNNGAIFTFENKVIDWSNKTQKWTLIEKIVPQGNNSRQQLLPSGNENDNFGRCVYIHRTNRSDADYTIIGGAENHKYSSSGHSPLNMAGSVYANDVMLRSQYPALQNVNTYIDTKVFGERTGSGDPFVRIITQNNNSNSYNYASGLIYTDSNGSIFLEASGQDLSTNKLLIHRPYIESVDGLYYFGTNNSGNLPLFVNGGIEKSQNMNIFVYATTGNVYNNIGLHTSSIVDFGSGLLNFYLDCPAPTQIFASGLILTMASGTGLGADTLNMRIRGY